MTYHGEDVRHYCTGEIIKIDGKKYRLMKKTSTAISIERYYWFHAVADWVIDKIVNI